MIHTLFSFIYVFKFSVKVWDGQIKRRMKLVNRNEYALEATIVHVDRLNEQEIQMERDRRIYFTVIPQHDPKELFYYISVSI